MATSHMIGCCTNQRGTAVCLFICWPPGLCWVCPISVQPIQQLLDKKKCLLFVFSISKFKSLLFLAFLYYCKPHFDTFVSGNASARAPVAVQQSFIWHSLCLTSAFCLEWNECAMFYRSVSKLFQLLSQLSRLRQPWFAGEVGKPSGQGGMLWPLVYFINL